MLLPGVGDGKGYIGDISRSQLQWWCLIGVGRDSLYAILGYICHKGAFHVCQTDSDIVGSEPHPGEQRTGYWRGVR